VPIDKPSRLRKRAEAWWQHKQATDPSAPYGGWYEELAWLTGYRAAMRDRRKAKTEPELSYPYEYID
jgi:hypothetical protein